jgi:pimeloyl-ACP methyl ester carboxylesterase
VVGLLRRTRYARRGDLRIAYQLRGGAVRHRPALVLIQGLGFSRAGWGPVVEPLRRRFRLVLVDNRGSGRSTAPAGVLPGAHRATIDVRAPRRGNDP